MDHYKVTTAPSAIMCTVCSCCVVRTVKFNCCLISDFLNLFKWFFHVCTVLRCDVIPTVEVLTRLVYFK